MKTTLQAEAGRSYVMHQQVDYGFGIVKCRPVWVTEEAAEALFDDSAYRVLTAVPKGETVPPNPPRAPSAANAGSPAGP